MCCREGDFLRSILRRDDAGEAAYFGQGPGDCTRPFPVFCHFGAGCQFCGAYSAPRGKGSGDPSRSGARLERGLLTVAIGGYQGFADRCILPNPEEIAAFVNGAEYIVTDTFHGAVFAILRHKRFAAFVRDGGGALPGNVNKLGDLLGRLGLRDRTADAESIEAVLEQSVDYSEIDRLLLKERERSLEFLQENLKEELAGEET